MTRFWNQATPSQRLAQIDAGIELQMSILHIAINCGATHRQVKAFGHSHGRVFNGRPGIGASQPARISMARRNGDPNTSMRDAFSIFEDSRRPSFGFLDEVNA